MAYHKVASRRAHNRAVEELRRAMPLNTYLFLMHQAATTGAVPVLDERGKPTGAVDTLKPQERIDTIKYLIDKTMPALKSADAPPPDNDEELLDATTTASLTTAELIDRMRQSAPAANDAVPEGVPAGQIRTVG